MDHTALLMNAAHAVADGVIVADERRRLVLFNRTAERILGAGPTEEAPERWAEVYGAFMPDGATPFSMQQSPLLRALQGEDTDGIELLIRNAAVPDGMLISAAGRPVRSDSGAIVGAVVIFRDITELRRATDRLERTVATLRSIERQKTELASVVVHDLHNPLSVVIGNAQFMLDQPGQSAENVECLRDVRRAAESMRGMVLDLLDIGRSETGALDPELENVEVAALLAAVCTAMRSGADDRRQRIAVVPPIEGLRVRADPALIRRVLQNLVASAIKHGPDGGAIRIETGADAQHVVVRIDGQHPAVSLPPQASVGEIHADVERSALPGAADSGGLGLRFCRLAVLAMSGELAIEDGAAAGTCFSVRLARTP
jgi:signal transduction histidine kinase